MCADLHQALNKSARLLPVAAFGVFGGRGMGEGCTGLGTVSATVTTITTVITTTRNRAGPKGVHQG